MAETYNQDGYAQGYPPGIERHFWHVARNDIVYRWLCKVLEDGDLVMDVGCGTGLVVNDLKSRQLNIRGVELGPAPVMPGLEDDVQTWTDLFDLDEGLKGQIKAILLLDVIEHMQHRREFIHRIYSELPNCRLVLITVPARMEIWSEFDDYWGHHLRFNRPGLEGDIAAAGFKVDKTSYFFHWIYLSSLLFRLLRVKRDNAFQPIPATGLKASCHRLLGLFTCLESRLLPGWLPGSSIISLATREGPVSTVKPGE